MALATISRIIGPAPRDTGSQMLFGSNEMAGFFSGGCIESDVALHARCVISDGKPRLLVYGDGSPWIDIRLVCGGRMEIFVERISADDPAVAGLGDALSKRRPVLYRTDGQVRQITACILEEAPPDGMNADGQVSRFYTPPPRLVVFGADPTALAIVRLASTAGMETILVRDDGVTSPSPLSSVHLMRSSADNALAELKPDRWTAIIAATHDSDRDHAVLRAAFSGDAGYVGVLGAASRMPQRTARLKSDGVKAIDIQRLKGPIGHKALGNVPFAIAAGVIAEIFEALGTTSR